MVYYASYMSDWYNIWETLAQEKYRQFKGIEEIFSFNIRQRIISSGTAQKCGAMKRNVTDHGMSSTYCQDVEEVTCFSNT
ncbi:hypothetical protein TNCV_3271361 [Trichonephila clavipes]|nr:hypothetical protein TNCV_3271361 [Trichonephila clavipes]